MTRSKFRTMKRDEKPPTRKPLAGLNRWECTHHGFIVDAIKGTVWALCPCGRSGKLTIEGAALTEDTTNPRSTS
jgi:hypothetical protein